MNPFVTSRDTTAAGFLAETGLSPLDVDDIIMVIRAFPIRVAGNSGPLPNEIDWETISNHHGKGTICERSSVTDKVRRVAVFDPEVVKMAIYANNPTQIVINHVDYLPSDIPVSNFIKKVSKQIGRDIHLIGTSPSHLSHFEE
jgi:adenylosuccinate synthase